MKPGLTKSVRELTEGQLLNYNLTASNATRVFIDDPSAVASHLPWLGDQYPPDNDITGDGTLLYVDDIAITKYDRHPNINKYVVHYSPRISGGTGKEDEGDTSKYYFRNYQIGAEMISISGTGNGYTWSSDSAAVGQKIGKRIGVGGFTIERRSSRDTFPKERVRNEFVGKINAAEFELYPANTVLCEGVDGVQYINDAGQVRFKISMKFRYREQSWLMLLRESNGLWDTVEPSLYETCNMSILIEPGMF